MQKRRAAIGLVVCLLIAGGVWVAVPGHSLNEDAMPEIKVGMSPQEVIDLLGAPPGNYTTSRMPGTPLPAASWQEWVGPRTALGVCFESDRVTDMQIVLCIDDKRSMMGKIRTWWDTLFAAPRLPPPSTRFSFPQMDRREEFEF